MGAFLVDLAIEHVNLHKRVALKLMLFFGTNAKMVLLGFMLVTCIMSMFCSNTSTTAMMIPFILGKFYFPNFLRHRDS